MHNSSEGAEIALHKYCMKLCVQTHTKHRAICKTWLQRVKENVEAFASISGELLVLLEKSLCIAMQVSASTCSGVLWAKIHARGKAMEWIFKSGGVA